MSKCKRMRENGNAEDFSGGGCGLEINVTKIVKYVCFASILIIAIIFGEHGYAEYIRSKGKRVS